MPPVARWLITSYLPTRMRGTVVAVSGGTTHGWSDAGPGLSSQAPDDTSAHAYCAGVGGTQIQIALSGVIPAVVAMWLVDRLDAKRPEPPRLRRLVTGVGMVSVIPAIVLELVVQVYAR